ncbi:hypothetical protein ACFWP3_14870 [Streptomyces sp. NPDC058525]|uniref:hypothetical protein n=1 Tax=Streptomyces sp. NPDC058525 TaxID=3346538 RepID=UPI003662526D
MSDFRQLEGHAFIQSNLQGPAPAIASWAMALLSEATVSSQVERISWLIGWILGCEGEPDSTLVPIYSECVAAIRDGILIIYGKLFEPVGSDSIGELLEILEIVDRDPRRLAFYKDILDG